MDVILTSPIMGSTRLYEIPHTQNQKIRISAISRTSWVLEAKRPKSRGMILASPIMGLAKCIRFPIARATQLLFWQFPRFAIFLPPKCQSPGV